MDFSSNEEVISLKKTLVLKDFTLPLYFNKSASYPFYYLTLDMLKKDLKQKVLQYKVIEEPKGAKCLKFLSIKVAN